jgi:hypothetical protein
LEKDWEARFGERHTTRPTLLQLIRTKPAKIAAGYWAAVLVVFLSMQAAGFDMIGNGAIPVAAVTAPWSLLVIAATSSTSSTPSQALLRPFISTVGTFLIFPALCGGLNAVLIFTLGTAIQRRRHRNL